VRKHIGWVAAAALFLMGSVSHPAPGFFLYGPQFLTACESADALQLGVCLGYIQGVADALQDQHTLCLPRIGVRELRPVVVKSLHEKPEDLSQPAISLISRSLSDAYPCAK
jgi:Rap1a immunity proteins